MDWVNEPAVWTRDGTGVLELHVEPGTDLWRHTHYGFVRDSGHLGGWWVEGDVDASVRVSADYAAQYDQAGLGVRLDSALWLKCGIEYVDGAQQVSCVVTRGHSDWSVAPLAVPAEALWLRLQRRGDAVTVSWSTDRERWSMLRMAYLPEDRPALVGACAAAPDGPGFVARFADLLVTPVR